MNGYNTKVLMLLYFLNQVSVETMMVTLETMFLGQTGILTDSVIVTGKYLTKSLGNVRNYNVDARGTINAISFHFFQTSRRNIYRSQAGNFAWNNDLV